jgi:hypothetical protein
VFDENNKEYICKIVVIRPSSWTEIDPNNHDWNIACEGEIKIHKNTSAIEIV